LIVAKGLVQYFHCLKIVLICYSGCLVLAVPPSACDEETLTDSLLLYIMSCNCSCSSCQLRYVQ